jgi:hypothetical protein
MATSQEVALRTSTEKWNDEVGVLVTALTAVVATSLDQMVSFKYQLWEAVDNFSRKRRQLGVQTS